VCCVVLEAPEIREFSIAVLRTFCLLGFYPTTLQINERVKCNFPAVRQSDPFRGTYMLVPMSPAWLNVTDVPFGLANEMAHPLINRSTFISASPQIIQLRFVPNQSGSLAF
jgi:hypothetical protein